MSWPVPTQVNYLYKGVFLQFVLNLSQIHLPLTRSHAHIHICSSSTQILWRIWSLKTLAESHNLQYWYSAIRNKYLKNAPKWRHNSSMDIVKWLNKLKQHCKQP